MISTTDEQTTALTRAPPGASAEYGVREGSGRQSPQRRAVYTHTRRCIGLGIVLQWCAKAADKEEALSEQRYAMQRYACRPHGTCWVQWKKDTNDSGW